MAKARSALKNKRSLSIRISAANVGHGESHLALTQRQVESASKKQEAGLGSQLTVSHKALEHTQTHGSGFGDMLKRGAKAVAAYGIRAGGNALADHIQGSGIKRRPKRKVKGKGFMQRLAAGAVRGVANIAASAIEGSGVKRRSVAMRKRKVGKGFLTSVLASGARGLGGLVGSAIEGSGVKRCRCHMTGHGVYAPGY